MQVILYLLMKQDDINNSTTLGTILGLEYALGQIATKAEAESRSTHMDGWAV